MTFGGIGVYQYQGTKESFEDFKDLILKTVDDDNADIRPLMRHDGSLDYKCLWFGHKDLDWPELSLHTGDYLLVHSWSIGNIVNLYEPFDPLYIDGALWVMTETEFNELKEVINNARPR